MYYLGKAAVAVAATIACCSTAHAVDVSQKMVDFSTGKEMHNCPSPNKDENIDDYTKRCEKYPVLLFKDVAIKALTYEFPDEMPNPRENKAGISGEEKAKRGFLAYDISHAKDGKIDLSSEEITTLKTLIAKGYGAVIVTDAYKIIDPNYKPK